ncbi:hypothetical protein HDV00_000313 [Rhizophlyctis rosea]|nr:hypothetical protein HDV00_000313 [Rhizophlyctis rosea]
MTVLFLSLVTTTVENATILFVRLAQDTVGEWDLLLTPSTTTENQLLLNYTSIKYPLVSASGVQGAVPRWMLPVNMTLNDVNNSAIAMIFDWNLEKQLGLGAKWPYQDLGKNEVSMSASVLRAYKIQPNSGAKVNLTFTLNGLLSGSSSASAAVSQSAQGSAGKQSSVIQPSVEGELGPGTGTNSSSNDTATTPDVTASTTQTSTEPTPQAALIPPYIAGLFPPDVQKQLNDIASITDSNGNYIIPQDALSNQMDSISFTEEFTDAIDSPYGKYPPKIGNVVILGYEASQTMIRHYLNTTFRNNPAMKLTVLALEAQRNTSSTDVQKILNVMQGNVNITDYVMSVIVMKQDADKTYVKSDKKRTADMIRFSNAVAGAIGISAGVDYLAPVYTMLGQTEMMSIYLQEAFFTVVVILCFLAVILIYSLLLTDVESKTFEYGMLRTLGLKHKSVMGLLVCQAVFFSIPGITLGLIVAYLLHLPIARLLSNYASSPLSNDLSTSGIILGVVMGTVLPLIGMLHPIRRALSKTLREALDLFHSTVNDTVVVVQRLEKIGMKPLEAAIAAILFLFGFMVYYIVPLTFVLNNVELFFRIMTIILLAMVIGAVLVGQILQSAIETLFASLIVLPHDRPLLHIVNKNLASHARRNRMTALMFTLCLAYIIFVAAMFNVQTASVRGVTEWDLGADIVATGPKWSNPLPEARLRKYFASLKNGTDAPDTILEGFTFVTFDIGAMDEVQALRLTTLAPIDANQNIKLYGVEPSFLDGVLLQYYDYADLETTLPIPSSTPGGIEMPNPFGALNLTINPEPYGTSSKTAKLPPPQIGVLDLWGSGQYSSNRTYLYSKATPIILSSGMTKSAQISIYSLTQFTIGYWTGGPWRVDKTYLTKPVAMLDKMPAFPSVGPRGGGTPPVFMGMEKYERLMRFVQAETGQDVMDKAPKEQLLVRVRKGSTKKQVDELAADLVTVIGDSSVKVTTVVDETGSTEVATEYITIIFYIVSAVGVLFSFFVLWLSFTANIHENAWEFGVLRSLGFPVSSVIKIYIYEALCIMFACTLIGTAVGLLIALAVALQLNLYTQLPYKFYFPSALYGATVGASFLVSLLGSYLPATRRAAEKIAVVLKGE